MSECVVSMSLPRVNLVGLWRRDTKHFCYYPPPTESGRLESGRLLEITENFCYYPPPPVSCFAPPRLPAPDPPLIMYDYNYNIQNVHPLVFLV